MIAVKFRIRETDNKIELMASGGNVGGTSKLERGFTRKFLAYVNKFNTSYTKCKKMSRIRIRATK